MNEIYYKVGRPTNGIWLHANERLIDDQGHVRRFKGKANDGMI